MGRKFEEPAANRGAGVRLYYRAREVAALTGLGLRTVYEGIYAGWIPSRKIGSSRLIPAAWLEAYSDADAQREYSHQGQTPNNRYSLGLRPRAAQAAAHLLRLAERATDAPFFRAKKPAIVMV